VNSLLHQLEQRLDDFSLRLETAVSTQLRHHQRNVANLAAAVLRHDPRQGLAKASERLTTGRTHLVHSMERRVHESAARLSSLDARLHSLSPLAVLERGYALVLTATGGVVRSALQVAPGDKLVTRLSDGAFISRVESAASNQSTKK
jgi:exodeoxyribonuclease VII large subunit